MPKVIFDKTIKVSGIKFYPNIATEVTDELAKEAVQLGGWVVAEDKPRKDLEEVKPEVKEEIEELLESTKDELMDMAKDLKIPNVKKKNKTELAKEIVEKVQE